MTRNDSVGEVPAALVGREVSARAIIAVWEGVRAMGLDPAPLAQGTGCTAEELLRAGERFSWDVFLQIMSNLGAMCSDDQIVAMGADVMDSPFVRTVFLPTRMLLGLDDIFRWVFGPNGPPSQLIAVTTGHLVELAPGHFRLQIRVRRGYRPSRENFLLLRGSITSFARLTGTPITVSQSEAANGVDYDITFPPRSTVLSLARRAVARIRPTTRLSRMYAELSKRYGELEREVEQRIAAENRYRDLFENAPLPVYVFEVATLRFLAVNRTTVRVYGYSEAELLQMTIADIRPPEDVPAMRTSVANPLVDDAQVWRHRKKDGTILHVQVSARDLTFAGKRARLIHVFDVTQRLVLEEQLRQAQKLEAIGQLAGGVAHDFNNLLMVISSYTELLLMQSRDSEDLRAIRTAAARGADLTQKLLAFARRKVIEPRVLDLCEIVEDMRLLLRPVLQRHELVIETQARGRIRADRSSIEQIIMNLAVNARDAMPDGGRLELAVRDAEVDADFAREHPNVIAGPHVVLTATDNGSGMDATTRERVFEPFFTTKAIGKGTGLGLSTVLGIVQQNGGHIELDSAPGRGTRIAIYFPANLPADELAQRRLGGPSILLVEDDDVLRTAASDVLQEHGFRVLTASDAPSALEICASETPIDLLVSDVRLHQSSGIELAKQMRQQRPSLRVLWMSGYTSEMFSESAGSAFLEKPFTAELLVERVRSLL